MSSLGDATVGILVQEHRRIPLTGCILSCHELWEGFLSIFPMRTLESSCGRGSSQPDEKRSQNAHGEKRVKISLQLSLEGNDRGLGRETYLVREVAIIYQLGSCLTNIAALLTPKGTAVPRLPARCKRKQERRRSDCSVQRSPFFEPTAVVIGRRRRLARNSRARTRSPPCLGK